MMPAPIGPVVPITGSHATVVQAAAALRDLAARIAAIDAQLADLRDGVMWESVSGWRFDGALRTLPDVLDLLQARYRAAADALTQWSVDLRVGIQQSRLACADHERALIELDGIERNLQAAALDPSGAQYERLRTRQVRATQQAVEAQEACSRAWLRLHEAAEVCAASLRAAAADSMVDSTAYRLVRGTRSVAGGLSGALAVAALVPSPVQAFAAAGTGVAAGAAFGADLVLLLGYDDGSWGEVLISGLALGATKSASGLTRAAGTGAVKGVNGGWTGQRLRTADRLRAGRTQIAADLRAQRDALRTPVVRPAPGASISPSHQLPVHRRTLDLIEAGIEKRVFAINDRWQMALAGGGNAVTLQAGADAIRVAHAARETYQASTWTGEQLGSARDRRDQRSRIATISPGP
ncbi:MAG TPA: hypothetical protein GXZ60_13925 [Intrasporangiaceae bacterium]|nr:hypothetical protein [Intrasporangiaceae bacterium]